MQARANVDVLLVRLRQAQAEYEWARLRGDPERAARARIKMEAITAERDHLYRASSGTSAIKALVA